MQITRMVTFWMALALVVVAGMSAVWRTRRQKPVAAAAGMLCLLLVLGVAEGAWAWATTPAVPQGIAYDGQGWYPEWSGPLSSGPCLRATSLRDGLEWPLRRVGRISWVTWDSETSVERSARGYVVFESSLGNEIYVAVNPNCYLPYVSV